MSSWRKYGGTNTFEKTSDTRVNSIVTNYFTILKQITNDVDISGNLTVAQRLNIYGDVSFNNDLSVEGNVIIHEDLDISGNCRIHQNQYIDGNLTLLNHLFFQSYPTDVYMYGDGNGIAINKEIPEADLDICGNNTCILNVKSGLAETHNILCRNKDDRGIMLGVDEGVTSLSFFYDSTIDINNLHKLPDAHIEYLEGGVLQIDASSHVQIVSNLVVTDNSLNIVNDAVLTVYNDLENDKYLYDIYDVSSAYTGSAIAAVAKDNSSNVAFNLITKYSQVGGAIYGGTYPKNNSKGMLSLGTTDFANKLYAPAQTIVSGTSNVINKNTIGINKAIPRTDKYAVDMNGNMHIECNDVTTTANIPFEIESMRFSRQYSNYGIVVGGVYKYTVNDTTNTHSQEAYVTIDGGSSWYPSVFLSNNPNYKLSFMRTSWVYDNNYAITYGQSGIGFCLDISNNVWYDKTMNNIGTDTTTMVIDIFACDFSGNKNNNNALAKVFFIMENATRTEFQLRYFNAAFGSSADTYALINNTYGTKFVLFKNNNDHIQDNTSPLTYYRYSNITGKCIDGAGFIPGYTTGNGGYIYIAGDTSIRKYFFSDINYITERTDCSHNVNGGYNAISVVDMSNVIAVGNGFITFTKDGKTWVDISRNTADLTVENTIFKSVYAYDVSNAIAVGYKGAMVYTTDGFYTWKNMPKSLFDLSGAGFPLIDASLNSAFMFNKNAFTLSSSISTFIMNNDASNIGQGKIIYNYVPDLMNNENNYILDVCGNMTIGGNIIMDKPSGKLYCTGNNFYLASDTSNIYIGDGKSRNIYLGNGNIDSTVYVNSKINFNGNLRLDGGFSVTNGNILVTATGYVVSYGIDVSYANISVLNVTGGNAISRGTDLSYAFHVKGYRPAARIDASLSVNSLYVDTSSVFLGPAVSNYKHSSYISNPALYIGGYSNFGPYIAMDGSNNILTLSNGIDAVNNPPNNLYGGLYLKDGTGAFIDGNVYIARNMKISGTGANTFTVMSGTSTFSTAVVLQTMNVNGNIAGGANLTVAGNLTVSGTSRFYNKLDISGNVDISGNLTTQGNITYRGSLINGSDYRIKTNVIPLEDTSFNVDNLIPKYYHNTMANIDQIGFIAHELQEYYPFLVSGEKDGPEIQGVNYSGLIGVLVKEIQGLKQRVAILENRGV